MLGRCCWVKKYIEHELCSIVMRRTTYSKQKHPLGWGGEGKSATTQATGLLTVGELERDETHL
jgi:hypothetical protein